MVKPLFTVRDLSPNLSDNDEELLRNYEFNISRGILQHVSRFFDALALMDEHGKAPPARGEGGMDADSARGGVMGFGHKRNVCNLEKKPVRRVAWEQQEKERIQNEAAKVAALEAKVAEMQALAALCGSALVPDQPRPHIAPPHIPPAPSAFTHLLCALRTCCRQYVSPPPVAPPQEQAAWRWFG